MRTGAQETRLTYELFSCPRLWRRERATTTQKDFRVVLLPKTVATTQLPNPSPAQDCGQRRRRKTPTSEPLSSATTTMQKKTSTEPFWKTVGSGDAQERQFPNRSDCGSAARRQRRQETLFSCPRLRQRERRKKNYFRAVVPMTLDERPGPNLPAVLLPNNFRAILLPKTAVARTITQNTSEPYPEDCGSNDAKKATPSVLFFCARLLQRRQVVVVPEPRIFDTSWTR